MKQSNKIQAFTLSEMIVVLILTGIVVGLAFSVLTLVQKHMQSIQHNFNQNAQLNLLETSLWLDFNRYQNIAYDNIENQLLFSSEVNTVSYQFSKDYIVKDLDTFQIKLQRKSFFFNGNSIEKGYIDAIKLETTKAFQNQQLFIFKDNDASAFMN